MQIGISAIGLFCSAGTGPEGATGGRPGEVPGFRPHAYVANRKSLKLMNRAVRLGVSSIALALSEVEDLAAHPPFQRAMFVGANPLGEGIDDLVPALDASTDLEGRMDLARFAQDGIPTINPLWLVKGLSNNVLGFASAIHDFQGANGNYCEGDASGFLALREAMDTILDRRAHLAVACACDSLIQAIPLFPGRELGEGAACFVLREARPRDHWHLVPGEGGQALECEESSLGYLGVAGELISLARALYSVRHPVTVGRGTLAMTAIPV